MAMYLEFRPDRVYATGVLEPWYAYAQPSQGAMTAPPSPQPAPRAVAGMQAVLVPAGTAPVVPSADVAVVAAGPSVQRITAQSPCRGCGQRAQLMAAPPSVVNAIAQLPAGPVRQAGAKAALQTAAHALAGLGRYGRCC